MNVSTKARFAIQVAVTCSVLAACATRPAEPLPGPKIVHVEVPVSCVAKDFPPPPAYTDTRQALQDAPDMAERYNLLAGNWFLRDARLTALEKQLSVCR